MGDPTESWMACQQANLGLRRSLQWKKVAELREKLKEDTGKWEEEIFRFVCVFAQTLAKDILEELDNDLMQERDDGMKVIGFKKHWLTTISGDIRIRRRLYRDKDGDY